MAPTIEEELKLRIYNGDVSQLGLAELFLKTMVDIPFSSKSWESLLFICFLREEVSSTEKMEECHLNCNLQVVSSLSDELENAEDDIARFLEKEKRIITMIKGYDESWRLFMIVQEMTNFRLGLQGKLLIGSRKGVLYVDGGNIVMVCAKHFGGNGGRTRGITIEEKHFYFLLDVYFVLHPEF